MMSSLDPAGVAVFIAVVASIVALASGSRVQWGTRRIAVGIAIGAIASAGLILAPLRWWWLGLLFGGYQIFLGWNFVPLLSPVEARFEYVPATARVLSYIAVSDGPLSRSEISTIIAAYERTGFASQLQAVRAAIYECEQAIRLSPDTEHVFMLLPAACAAVAEHVNRETRLDLLRTAIALVNDDGVIDEREQRALYAAAQSLGLTVDDLDRASRGAGSDGHAAGDHFYQIL